MDDDFLYSEIFHHFKLSVFFFRTCWLFTLIFNFLSPVQMQIINVYNQQYESAAAFWPDVHGRVIGALVISQLLLIGLLATKKAAQSTPFLLALPVLTIWFHRYCKGRFEPAFVRNPLQVCWCFNSFILIFYAAFKGFCLLV